MTACTIRALGPDDAVTYQALLARARDLAALAQIDLTVTAGNAAAQALYAHCGFGVVGHWPRAIQVDGRYHDKVRMQLQLR